ncbi:unnamed protein product [Caenorhabditis sp. 36 PRJEB53466]|nr:unnamed protein product [Caenorhabditis sp. 36 PRJEB53466]
MSQLQKSQRVDELSDTVDKAMSEEAGEDAQRKAAEREAKKAEVRKRLEEAGNKKKAKKGFLTPERKKKLRKLLMVKAAEDLKRQQLLKEQERHKALADRTVPLPNVDSIEDKGQLEKIYGDLWSRLTQLEEEKYDINQIVSQTEAEINSLTIEVNDLRGKFVKPSLKKVSKYDNKFKKSGEQKVGGKEDFRANLKIVKKDVLESITNVKKKDEPNWSKKNKDAKAEEAAPAAAASEPVAEPEAAEPEVEEEEGEEEEEEEDCTSWRNLGIFFNFFPKRIPLNNEFFEKEDGTNPETSFSTRKDFFPGFSLITKQIPLITNLFKRKSLPRKERLEGTEDPVEKRGRGREVHACIPVPNVENRRPNKPGRFEKRDKTDPRGSSD